MNHVVETIQHKDLIKTALYCYRTEQEPIGSILILHGMAEHHKRYESFMKQLVAQGYDVFLYDHRGHGVDKLTKELGYISPSGGHMLLIWDGIDVLNHIKKNSRSKKIFLFGHSMGSLVSRCIIQSYDLLEGVILCGTTYPSRFKLLPGILLTTLLKKIQGPKYPSLFLDQLIFGTKHYKKLRKRTTFDWLTRSNPAVGAYIHDPYCGFICSVSFYQDLLKLTLHASTSSRIIMTKKQLPIFLISGEEDPVGGMGREVNTLFKHLKKWGFDHVTMKLYPQCRHELLQELERNEIIDDIITWLKAH